MTEKGYFAIQQIKQYFPDTSFTASQLSEQCGVKITSSTLISISKEGYLIKYNTSPIQYKPTSTFLVDIEKIEQPTNKKNNNSNLHSALKKKDDEYYTFYEDIELECSHYKEFFKNKIIYLNCDNENSNFWKYFLNNFKEFKLKSLWATHYSENKNSYLLSTNNGIDIIQKELNSNGDYSSTECVELLDKCDIIITNPPFSKSKEFINLIVQHNKYFLVIGNENAFSSTLIFPLLKDEKVWTGFNKVKKFLNPNNEIKNFGNICWFTNIPVNKDIPFIKCTKHYNPEEYLTYNNFEAINVEKIKDIPYDYDGIMGVPISYVGKHNPEQFKILGLAAGNTKTNHLNFSVPYTPHPLDRGGCGIVKNNVRKYTRVFIQRRK